ncbi:MAG: SGNH/GDSL hydrolase family protein [Terriglobales bacterium]
MDGLPGYTDNQGQLFRLPIRLKDTFPQDVWRLSQEPSGGRIRFRTNSSALAIRLEYPAPPWEQNQQAFGQSGVDLYVDNTYWDTAVAGKDAGPGKIVEHVYFNFGDAAPRVWRNITLYLPLYIGVKIIALGVDQSASINGPPRFARPNPVVFYGTSITQGCCASRPGMSYEAIVGRRLNIDFVNLGFDGSGRYEPAMAQALAAIDASCYVLDGSNIRTAEQLAKVLPPFIRIIRAKRPAIPILVVSLLYSSQELNYSIRKQSINGRNEVARAVVSRFIEKGDRNIQLLEGTDLLSPLQGDGLTDGAHPNDLGFEWIAHGMEERLATMLGLY